MSLITAATLRGCWPAVRDAEGWAAALALAAEAWGVTTAPHVAAWLAQCGHECGDGTALAESMFYTHAERILDVFRDHACVSAPMKVAMRAWHPSVPLPPEALAEASLLTRDPEALANRVYAGREGNGHEASGDGWAMRGSGCIQVTFRNAWSAYGKAHGLAPDIAAARARTVPQIAADSAGWYFKARGLGDAAAAGDFDRVACLTAGKKSAETVIGIANRRARYARCRRVLG